MGTRSAMQKTSPAKWAAVGVLALVLGYVLLKPGEQNSPQTTAAASPPMTGRTANRLQKPGVKIVKPIQTQPLPATSVASLLRYNPFEFGGGNSTEPVAAVKPNVDRPLNSAEDLARRQKAREAMHRKLSQQVVDVILESSKGRTARIGKRILKEGNPLQEGVSVRQIRGNRVVLDLRPDRNLPSETDQQE